MPQFAVYKNPGRNQTILFVVQIQTTRLDRSVGRVIVPLVRRNQRTPPDHPLTPHFVVQGQLVYADPLDISTVAALHLKNVLEIMPESDGDRIIRAIDEMISQA